MLGFLRVVPRRLLAPSLLSSPSSLSPLCSPPSLLLTRPSPFPRAFLTTRRPEKENEEWGKEKGQVNDEEIERHQETLRAELKKMTVVFFFFFFFF